MEEPSSFLKPGERLVLVSNRLPVVLQSTDTGVQVTLASGGLATGLGTPHREGGGPWVGWPGTVQEGDGLAPELAEALEGLQMVGVPLTAEEHDAYYHRISNRCLWPLFHYFTDQMCFDHGDWEVYRRVNRKFANRVLEHVRPDDLVFVQDFHLLLVPGMLREAMPELRIGFFLHIPFPSSEIYRILPVRREVLEGLLGADMIAFHTPDYVRHFRSALRRVLGVEVGATLLHYQGRQVRLLAQPLGIRPEEWEERAAQAEVQAELQRLRGIADGRRVILGVDRLDYTKGIPARLRAFAELLHRDPQLAEEVMMIQVAVPSRVEVEEYRNLKDEVDRLAGQINGQYGRLGRQPLHYHFRGVSPATLSALYQLADVALVTPLRDGLNLVAKEYVASRVHDDGVLVIGEFTGAAWELGEALHVNPFDVAGMAEALRAALDMPRPEQQRRMIPMRARLRRGNVHVWTRKCMEAIRTVRRPAGIPLLAGAALDEAVAAWRRAPLRELFLDYDGTLREFTERPEEAVPDPGILSLLAALAAAIETRVWVVSGRPHDLLRRWLGGTGAGLVAEHGAFVAPPGAEFRSLLPEEVGEWREVVLDIFHQFADRVPGSLIEEKPIGVAWHYRAADPAISAWQAQELSQHLSEVLGGYGVEILQGSKVLEVRPAGINKGAAVRRILEAEGREDAFLLAAGDDHTDEFMFRRMPEQAWTVLVGNRETAARWRLPDCAALRRVLEILVAAAPREVPAPPAG